MKLHVLFALFVAACASSPARTSTRASTPTPSTSTSTPIPIPTATATSTSTSTSTATATAPPCTPSEVLVPSTPADGFLMGRGTDRPHRVVLTRALCVDASETTVALYKECVDAGACKEPLHGDIYATYPRLPDHPVNMVSWNESRAYCTWRNKRLPTEAEWEWAAGGPTMTKFPWGDAPEASCETCDFTKWGAPKWMPGGDVGCHGGGTSPVGAHPKGDKVWPGGALHDLAGNVYEWVEDSFAAYSTETQTDPVARTDSMAHVLRGGAWNRSYSAMEITHRAASGATYKVPGIGVRCVRPADVR